MPRNNNDHYVSNRYLKKWADNKDRVCVLRQQDIMPFKTPGYWNDNSKKTATSNIAVMKNYSFTQENENKVTAIEMEGHDIIESILKNKALPNEVDLDPIYKLIALFLSNNPTFRGGIKSALNKNRENIIAALQALTEPQDEREFFMAAIRNISPLSDISLQIAGETLYPYMKKENFRFRLLRSDSQKSFITSDMSVVLIPPSNNHCLFNIKWRIQKFTWFYENGAMATLEVNLNNEGIIEGFTLCHPNSLDEPIQSAYISYGYYFSELNIHQIYFPISPQLALHGINTKYAYNEPNLLSHNIFLMLSQNETLEFNSWVLSYISDHSKAKAIGSNYGILEQSAIYHNSKNTTGPRYTILSPK